MARRKYVKDYKLNQSVDERGRLRSEPIYVGSYYVFRESAADVKAQAKKSLAACIGAWAAFIGSLFLNTGAMRLFHVSLPYAFTAIPLWLLTSVTIKAYKASGKLQHRDSDEMNTRYPACSMWSAILPIFALLGMLVAVIFNIGSLVRADIAFALLASVVCACAAYCFTKKSTFTTEEL